MDNNKEVTTLGENEYDSVIEIRMCGTKEVVAEAIENLRLIYNVKRVTIPYQFSDERKVMRLVYIEAKPKKFAGVLKLMK